MNVSQPRLSYSRTAGALLLGLLIASSWLVFPYFVEGARLLGNAGDNARLSKGAQVSAYYTRHLVNHPLLELSATFATNEFFQYVDQTGMISDLRPDRNFIFFVSENIHEGTLAGRLPDVVLHIGERAYVPERSIGPRIAEHHRITIYSIAKRDAAGQAITLEAADEIRLTVSNTYPFSPETLSFDATWRAPYSLPAEISSRADVTPAIALALGAGLLSSVLTPCLLQLVVLFGTVIGTFATTPGADAGNSRQLNAHIRGKVMLVALAFVAGFSTLYILAGALIGHVGHTAQLLFAEHSRSVAIASGILVICMGAWIGIRGLHTPAMCRVPDRLLSCRQDRRDAAGSLVVSMGYALGCTACFGGAIVATLIIYVGAIGSATIGATIMATFSVGVAIPFLLAAWFLSHRDSVVAFLATHARPISVASMFLVIAFGLILITDNFHVVSDAIYPYLGLR